MSGLRASQSFLHRRCSARPLWEEPLGERAAAAVGLLERLPDNRKVLVLADADVDGVSSATVLARALMRVGRRFRVLLSRRRDDVFFQELFTQPPDFLITADLGASEVRRFLKTRVPTIVLDHHTPGGDGDGSTLVHVNPHLEGEDGSRTASGAAVSFVFAKMLLDSRGVGADDLLPLALVGARGDRYHGGARGGLHGRLEAQVHGSQTAEWRDGPVLPDAPLGEAFAMSLDPFVGRAAGKPVVATKLLTEAGFDPTVRLRDLGVEARRKLGSWLALELLEQGALPSMVEGALAPTVAFRTGPLAGMDLDATAAVIDAACRADRAGDALAALLGSSDAYQGILAELEQYRQRVRDPVLAAARGRLVPLGPGHLLRIEHGRYSGCVADRVMAWTRAGANPVIVVGPTGSRIKVSLRARSAATEWHLDKVAEEAATGLGGVGGGHHLAAGATVAAEKEAQFLEAVATALERVVARHKPAAEPTGEVTVD